MKTDFTSGFSNSSGGRQPTNSKWTGQGKPQGRTYRPPKPAPDQDFVTNFRITETAFEAIKLTLGMFKAETGGLLLGNPLTGIITRFLFDQDARTSGSIYYPTVEFLNLEIPKYEAQGEHALGIAHSHPSGIIRPSGPDMSAAYSNITSPYNEYLRTWHMPIIQSVADIGHFEFYPYIVSCGGIGETVLHTPILEIVDENGNVICQAKNKTHSRRAVPQSSMEEKAVLK